MSSRIKSKKSDSSQFLVIGIDFGTTQSGVGWALSSSPTKIKHISIWDQESSADQDKVPTRISYNKKGKVTAWGIQDTPDGDYQFKYFKLLLSDDGAEAAQQLGDISSDIAHAERLNKSPINLAADFLRCLWLHTLKHLAKKLPNLLENLAFKVVVTVPANWDHAAQDRTRQAVEESGILRHPKRPYGVKSTELIIVSEPEASAFAVINDEQREVTLEKGQSFVVCDAGGGTVDLISYQVTETCPLALTMRCEPMGDTCGAIFLDRGFEELVIKLLSNQYYQEFKFDQANYNLMWNSWETHTRKLFKYGEKVKQWPIAIPDKRRERRENLQVTLPELNAVFDGACSKISALVRKQVDAVEKSTSKRPAHIFLVGGFGENTYLKGKLRRDFGEINISWPSYPIRAIFYGAVIRGFNDEIVLNHVPQYSYGFQYSEEWDDQKHKNLPISDRIEDPDVPGRYIAHSQVKWYLKRGQSVLQNDPIRHPFDQDFGTKSDLEDYKFDILYSKLYGDSTSRTNDVKSLCTIAPNFDGKLWETLEEKVFSDGVAFRRLCFTLRMDITAGSLRWRVYRGNDVVAENNVAVIFE